MKDMTSVATTMMTDDEKAEIEKQLNSEHPGAAPSTPSVAGASAANPTGTAEPDVHKPTTSSRPSSPPSDSKAVHQPTVGSPPATPSAATRPDISHHTHSSLVPHGENSDAPSPASPSPSSTKEREREAARKRQKISQEQKEKLREQDKERRKVMEARVSMLTAKMIERLRPFVDSKRPGEKDDPETVAFEAKMKREADDLKLESFGVEVREILCRC